LYFQQAAFEGRRVRGANFGLTAAGLERPNYVGNNAYRARPVLSRFHWITTTMGRAMKRWQRSTLKCQIVGVHANSSTRKHERWK
jgi:hypothetical protein